MCSGRGHRGRGRPVLLRSPGARQEGRRGRYARDRPPVVAEGHRNGRSGGHPPDLCGKPEEIAARAASGGSRPRVQEGRWAADMTLAILYGDGTVDTEVVALVREYGRWRVDLTR